MTFVALAGSSALRPPCVGQGNNWATGRVGPASRATLLGRRPSRTPLLQLDWRQAAAATESAPAEREAAAASQPRVAAWQQPAQQQQELHAEQQQQEQQRQHVGKGTVIGAISLIVGNTVGAGMLALPAVSAPAGILPTSLGLTAIWALLTLDALLIAEVNLAARAARDSAAAAAAEGGDVGAAPPAGGIVTLRQMAEFSLGSAGKGLTLVYLGLSYSLLTAYCTKASEVLDYFSGGQLPPLGGAALFCGAVGALLYKEGTRTIDSLNQGLTSVLLALFVFILTAGAAQSALPAALAAGGGLGALGGGDWGALGPAVPIMFLALVYHDLVPVIVSYLGGDRAMIRSAIILGSMVPLGMFLSWEAVSLSLLPAGLADASAGGGAAVLQASLQLAAEGAPGGAAALAVPALDGGGVASVVGALPLDGPGQMPAAVDPLQVFVRRSGPLVGSVVEGFSFLAVATSFIGTTLSLSETFRTEVPPLLAEASKQLRRATAAEASADASLSVDELACLASSGPSNGAGCSAAWAEDAPDAAGAVPAGADAAAAAGGGGDQRVLALALTLCPPLALAATNPDSFLGALEIAGGYFMTLLYGLLPPLMAWKLRQKLRSRRAAAEGGDGGRAAAPAVAEHVQQQQPQLWWRQHEDMVPGGLPVLGAMFGAACTIELSRLAEDAGLTGGPGNAALQGAIQAVLNSPAAVQEAVMLFLSPPM